MKTNTVHSDQTTVTCKRSRGFPFENLSFKINNFGYPEIIENFYDPKALEKIFEKNDQWIDIVKSFGCNRDTSQDIVQEMYFKVQKRLEKGTDIQYSEDDINYYYIFKVLRSLFLDLKRKESKVQIVELGEIENCELDINYEDAMSSH